MLRNSLVSKVYYIISRLCTVLSFCDCVLIFFCCCSNCLIVYNVYCGSWYSVCHFSIGQEFRNHRFTYPSFGDSIRRCDTKWNFVIIIQYFYLFALRYFGIFISCILNFSITLSVCCSVMMFWYF